MKTQVTAIVLQPDGLNNNSLGYQVTVIVGGTEYKFDFTQESSEVNGHQIEGIRGGNEFLELFRLNQHLGIEIYNLVEKIKKGHDLKFPMEVGEFYEGDILEANEHQERQFTAPRNIFVSTASQRSSKDDILCVRKPMFENTFLFYQIQ